MKQETYDELQLLRTYILDEHHEVATTLIESMDLMTRDDMFRLQGKYQAYEAIAEHIRNKIKHVEIEE